MVVFLLGAAACMGGKHTAWPSEKHSLAEPTGAVELMLSWDPRRISNAKGRLS
jgi:hypothetical protein